MGGELVGFGGCSIICRGEPSPVFVAGSGARVMVVGTSRGGLVRGFVEHLQSGCGSWSFGPLLLEMCIDRYVGNSLDVVLARWPKPVNQF